MPSGPILADHDQPEYAEQIISVWAHTDSPYLTTFSFSRVPAGRFYRARIPRTLAPRFDPERGIVLASLWVNGPVYGPADVFLAARAEKDGFRFVEDGGRRGEPQPEPKPVAETEPGPRRDLVTALAILANPHGSNVGGHRHATAVVSALEAFLAAGLSLSNFRPIVDQPTETPA